MKAVLTSSEPFFLEFGFPVKRTLRILIEFWGFRFFSDLKVSMFPGTEEALFDFNGLLGIND